MTLHIALGKLPAKLWEVFESLAILPIGTIFLTVDGRNTAPISALFDEHHDIWRDSRPRRVLGLTPKIRAAPLASLLEFSVAPRGYGFSQLLRERVIGVYSRQVMRASFASL
jgi:hypothetical protein